MLHGFTPRGIVGIADLPTAASRQLLAHDDGSISIYDVSAGGNPVPATVVPALPVGGIAAMKTLPLAAGLVLGGATNPALYSFDPLQAPFGTIQLTTIANGLPGAPVDYAAVPPPSPHTLTFDRPCGAAAELRIAAVSGQSPQLGNATYGLRLHQGLPGQLAWLVLGFGETMFPFPNGCRLHVAADALTLRTADGGGAAAVTIPIPSNPVLLGVRFLGQWLQVDGPLPFLVSDSAAIEIGL